MSSGLSNSKESWLERPQSLPDYTVEVDAKKVGHELQYNWKPLRRTKNCLCSSFSWRAKRLIPRFCSITLTKMEIDLNLDASINKNLALGPHDVEINTVAPGSAKRTVRLHHEVKEGQLNEHAKYLVGGQERIPSLLRKEVPRSLCNCNPNSFTRTRMSMKQKPFCQERQVLHQTRVWSMKGRLEVILLDQKSRSSRTQRKAFWTFDWSKDRFDWCFNHIKDLEGKPTDRFCWCQRKLVYCWCWDSSPFFDSRLK